MTKNLFESTSTQNMTQGSPTKLIFKFTLPLLLGNIFMQLYSFVDMVIVGRFLGVHALAAIGCTGPLTFLIFGLIFGATSGFSIYTGQKFGEGDHTGVRKSAAAGMYLTLICSTVIAVVGTSFARFMLEVIQTPEEILDDAVAYVSIFLAGIMLFAMLEMQTNLIRALGNSRVPTILSAVGLGLNIILDPIAIIYLDLGIKGAAYATLLSQFLANIVAWIYIRKNIPILRVRREDFKFEKGILWRHFNLGFPMGFQESTIAIGAVVLQIIVNGFGADVVAAYSTAQEVEMIFGLPLMSFSAAMATFGAQNYGAKEFARVISGFKSCLAMTVGFSIVAGISQILFGSELIEIFIGADQKQVLEYGSFYLKINGFAYWILAIIFVTKEMFQGLGLTFVPTISSAIETALRVISAFILGKMFGFFGLCFSDAIAWFGAVIPLAIAGSIVLKKLRSDSMGG